VNTPATSAVCIHHPQGDVKKISWDYDPVTSTPYLSTTTVSSATHWLVGNWEDGTTEVGSSGSPLFDQNHRIVGQLHGGFADCDVNLPDWYGKFSYSMTEGLRAWLDPENSGAMTLDGFDPSTNSAPTVVVSFSGHDIALHWDDLGAPYYHVYSATSEVGPFTTLEGTVTTNSYLDVSPSEVQKFYVVESSATP
jgi:hypothetical protein